MQFTSTLFALAALATLIVAENATPGFDTIISIVKDQNITAGTDFDIVWQPGSDVGLATITLMQGADPGTLDFGPVLASNVTNGDGKFTWSVPKSSAFKTYGIRIELNDKTKFQYSNPFHIVGGTAVTSSSSGTASGTASTSGSATSTTGGTSTVTAATTSSALNSTTSAVASSTFTSTAVTTPYTNVTTAIVTSSVTPSNSSLTLLTTVTPTKSSSGSGSSTTSTPAASSSKAAAAGNVAAGGLAVIGGMLMAFAL